MNDAIAMIRTKIFANFSLPLFLNERNKYPLGAVVGVITIFLYVTSNHYHLFEPMLLPMSGIDRIVPFMPNTVWIYTSEYFYFVVIYIFVKDFENANKFLYSFMALQIISVLIFWLWPTTFPRGNFPLPEDLNAVTYWLFSSVRTADTPANCAPSLHVSSCYLCSFIYLDDQREKFWFFFLWACAIAASTLTTKQHYLIDVVLGFLMAVIVYWVFHRLVQYRPRKIGTGH